jgi:hypothetical protein
MAIDETSFVRNSSIPLAPTQFEPDATRVVSSNFDAAGAKYASFKRSLPSNLSKGSDAEYDMNYLWKNQGMPKNFSSAQKNKMFTKESDGLYHGPSVESNTGRFLKAKGHPTLHKELDWYKGNTPEAKNFRKNNTIDSSGKYFQYVPKKKK